MNGSDFAAQHLKDSEKDFEDAVLDAVGNGDHVHWPFCDVPIGDRLVVRVTADYLAVGTFADAFRTPLSATSAQAAADDLGMLLPWRRLVDAAWKAAATRLVPRPGGPLGIQIGTIDQMSVRAFKVHNDEVQRQLGDKHDENDLVAGHKKDVVLTNRLLEPKAFPRVAIYGWHQLDGTPIQPLSLVHEAEYRDYSHGVRLVAPSMLVDGQEAPAADVLKDPVLGLLLADEVDPATGRPAPMLVARYA